MTIPNQSPCYLISDYYQRRIDNEKLKDIQKYIIRAVSDEQNNVSLATLFPTSMIIAMPLEEEELNVEGDEINIEFKGNVFIMIAYFCLCNTNLQ